MDSSKVTSFACETCRTGKRKCDGSKPKCSLCQRLGKDCYYNTEKRHRKRKYWDEDYVRGLEQQVKVLLEANEQLKQNVVCQECSKSSKHGVFAGHDQRDDATLANIDPTLTELQAGTDENSTTLIWNDQPRSSTAMEALSIMMWRTNLGDGATFSHEGNKSDVRSQYISKSSEIKLERTLPSQEVLQICSDAILLERLAQTFLDSINQEHQFTRYTSTDFLLGYPYQTIEQTFLHTAILAVGAAFLAAAEPRMGTISDELGRYAEKLMFECLRLEPSIYIVQGTSMLSFRSLAMGIDHMGWAFISMAGGLCVQLRLHVLAVEESKTHTVRPDGLDVRTFWMYYMVDKTAITILGRNCALPWRRVNVPDFATAFDPSGGTVEEISFAWQCRLWYAHDQKLDQIFAPSFDLLPVAQRVHVIVSTMEQLNKFFATRPSQLYLGQNVFKAVILFHLQYHMIILITMSPFLRMFATSGSLRANERAAGDSIDSSTAKLVLQSITASAGETIRLVRTYQKNYSFKTAHPVLVHHLLSAGLVLLMNATSTNASQQRQNSHSLHACMGLLHEIRCVWPLRAAKSLDMMRLLGHRWGVARFMPIQFAQPTSSPSQIFRPSEAIFDTRTNDTNDKGSQSLDRHNPDSAIIATELLSGFQELSDMADLEWPFEEFASPANGGL